MAGRKVFPINKIEMLNFKVPGALKVKFQEIVEREGLTPSEVLRNFVEKYVRLKGHEVGFYVVSAGKESGKGEIGEGY